jgi:Na+/proline symporter
MMNRSPSTRAILALLPVATILLMALIWSMVSGSVLAQEVPPTPMPTVTPWGGRRGVMPGGAAPLFPYWLAGLPIIAALVALIVWRTRRSR